MQIKITEMLDQATEYIESSEYILTETDIEKVKKSVLDTIASKRRCKKIPFSYIRTDVAVLAITLIVSGSTVIAKGLLPAAGKITSKNAAEITQKEFAHSYTDENSDETEEPAKSLNLTSLDKESEFNPYQELDAKRQYTITCEKKSSTYAADDFYLGNGYYAKLSSHENNGLPLTKGQKIYIKFTQSASSTDFSPITYIGVKYNDTYIDLGKFTEKNAGVIFEVPETGSYEFSITNLSDERVFYTNTTIYQEVSSNAEKTQK